MRARRVALAGLIALLAVAVPVLAYQAYTLFNDNFDVYVVVTGSMEPYVPRGSIVVVRKVYSPGEVGLGDVVAYRVGDYKILHRVVGFADEGVVAKGDAVANPELVEWERVEGVLVFGIPYGYLFLIAAFIVIAASLVILVSIGGRAR